MDELTELLRKAAEVANRLYLSGLLDEGIASVCDSISDAQGHLSLVGALSDYELAQQAKDQADEAWRDACREEGWIDREGMLA